MLLSLSYIQDVNEMRVIEVHAKTVLSLRVSSQIILHKNVSNESCKTKISTFIQIYFKCLMSAKISF